MKKLVTLLMALALVLSLSVTAFAADDAILVINDATARTYDGYQLLNLTTSLKCDHAEGEKHSEEDCYNYAYTVNEKYLAILQAEAGANNDIIAYLEGLQGGDTGTLHDAAEDIYAAIKDGDIDADEPNVTDTASIAQGYWLFADVTNLQGKNEANSLVIVDTKGQEELILSPKTGLPTIEKKVKDTNDSTGETTDWQDSADYDIGDTVTFKLTATLPENIAGYDTYMISFHDTLSDGLTLKPETIKVMVGETDVTDAFDYEAGAGGAFTITCDDVLDIAGVTKDTVFVVYYEATLDTDAEIGAAGNPNEVYLEFSNDPYSDGTGKTENDKVIVFTYQLTINKTDKDGNALKGAGFTLYKWYETAPATEDQPAAGEWRPVGDELVGDDMTTFNWVGLDDGKYKLEESTVPAGYNKMADIEFTITAEHDEEADDPALTSVTSTMGTVNDGIITDTVINNTGTVLPETGAKGTMMLITTSTILVVIAAVFMITRKKMSIYED